MDFEPATGAEFLFFYHIGLSKKEIESGISLSISFKVFYLALIVSAICTNVSRAGESFVSNTVNLTIKPSRSNT